MAGVDAGDLHVLAEEFLVAVLEAQNTVPDFAPGLGGAPERSYVSPGAPAFDCCPQTTVHIGPIGEGASSPLQPKASQARINRVTLIATVVQCVPTTTDSGKPPSQAVLEAAAEQINADKWALQNHIYNLIRAGQLFTLCQDVEWLGIQPIPLQGTCGGSILTIRAALDGYESDLST